MSLVKSINKVINARRGSNTIKQDHHEKIQQWMSYYRANVDGFHHYSKNYNGTVKNVSRLTMNMAKTIAQDKTSLMFSEEWNINVDNNQELLDKILEKNNVKNYLPIIYEKTIGYAGYSFIIEYIKDNGEVAVDFITGEASYVTGYNNNVITEIVTISQDKMSDGDNKSKYYNLLTFHKIEDGLYTIENMLFESKQKNSLGTEVPLDSVEEYSNLPEIYTYKTDIPHFQIIQLTKANQHDIDVPYSAPITADIIDTYRALDQAYDFMYQELELKRPRILISSKAIKREVKPGEGIVSYFDQSEPLYQVMNTNSSDMDPIKEINTGDLRVEQYISDINMNLKIISKQAGLGNDFYSFDQQKGLMTATQVVSDKSEMFRNMIKDRYVIITSLKAMVQSIGFLLGLDFGEIKIEFKDSIIVDDEKEKEDDLVLVDVGMMSKVRYLVTHKGLSEAEAAEWLNEVNNEIRGEVQTTPPQPQPEEQEQE